MIAPVCRAVVSWHHDCPRGLSWQNAGRRYLVKLSNLRAWMTAKRMGPAQVGASVTTALHTGASVTTAQHTGAIITTAQHRWEYAAEQPALPETFPALRRTAACRNAGG